MDADLDLALKMARIAGTMAMAQYRQPKRVTTKPDRTPVTATDVEIETALRGIIRSEHPGDAILGEEGGAEGTGGRRWILDPIDGTKNFMSQIPLFGTLIALERNGRTEVAVVSMPALNGGTVYFAVRGGGAWKMEGTSAPQRLHVNRVSRPEDGVLAWAGVGGMPSSQERRFHRLRMRFFLNRKVGNTWAHMLVAEGAAAAATAGHIHLWDIAAPALIVQEAGGRMSAWAGGPASEGTVVSSNGLLHSELVAELTGRRLGQRIAGASERIGRLRHRPAGPELAA